MAEQVGTRPLLSYITLFLLPLTSFLGYQCMLVPLFKLLTDPQTKGDPGPPQWNYTGYAGVDTTLTMLVNFFLQSFEAGRFALMPEFMAFIGPAAITPIIEMRRSGYRPTTIFVSMLVLGYLYQTMGAGVILPLWWALYLLLSGHETAPIPTDYSEAALFGYFLGFVPISLAMAAYQTPGIIAIWQFFPAYIIFFQTLSFGIQRVLPGGIFRSSYKSFQIIHSFNLMWSTVGHAYTLLRAFRSASPLDSMKDSYLPGYSLASDAFTILCQDFLKWDHIYIGATTLFAGLWLTRGVQSRLYAFAIFVASSLVLGAGAGLSIVWILKEKQLAELSPTSKIAEEKKLE